MLQRRTHCSDLSDCSRSLGDVINHWRRHTLELEAVPATEGPRLAETCNVPFTYCWSPTLVAKPSDWPSHIGQQRFDLLKGHGADLIKMSVASSLEIHRNTSLRRSSKSFSPPVRNLCTSVSAVSSSKIRSRLLQLSLRLCGGLALEPSFPEVGANSERKSPQTRTYSTLETVLTNGFFNMSQR